MDRESLLQQIEIQQAEVESTKTVYETASRKLAELQLQLEQIDLVEWSRDESRKAINRAKNLSTLGPLRDLAFQEYHRYREANNEIRNPRQCREVAERLAIIQGKMSEISRLMEADDLSGIDLQELCV